MQLVNQTWGLLKKEILLEWRSKYAFNGVLLYVVATVFVCYISFSLTPGFSGLYTGKQRPVAVLLFHCQSAGYYPVKNHIQYPVNDLA